MNVSPWARLMRELPLPKLFAMGAGLTGASVGLLLVLRGTALRWLGPFLAIALGIGGAALLVGVFRLVWAGGRSARIAGAGVLAAGLAFGVSWWVASSSLGLTRVVCWDAIRGYSLAERARTFARCEERVGSVPFALARALGQDVTEPEEHLAQARRDQPRYAEGRCPRYPLERCRCGAQTFPEHLQCMVTGCVVENGVEELRCE